MNEAEYIGGTNDVGNDKNNEDNQNETKHAAASGQFINLLVKLGNFLLSHLINAAFNIGRGYAHFKQLLLHLDTINGLQQNLFIIGQLHLNYQLSVGDDGGLSLTHGG